MYVHIGDATILRTNDIIAIVDQQTIDLTSEQAIGIIYDDTLLTNGNFKSIVVTDNQLYLSSFSSNTLKKGYSIIICKSLGDKNFTGGF
ncbi:extracellular matrix regulator RemB [Bacillus sp. FJAT-52991]|uniref:DUF370 domain-containing protein n=1 Tax=Bacillus kandeliae TaxID=3129297 RepID=A0ABZ2N619_9BACI